MADRSIEVTFTRMELDDIHTVMHGEGLRLVESLRYSEFQNDFKFTSKEEYVRRIEQSISICNRLMTMVMERIGNDGAEYVLRPLSK